jgi:outer membrane protein assembly factor BamE (lipoprotein component of BamABCDE complex)
MLHRLTIVAGAAVLLAWTAGCAPTRSVQGFIAAESQIAALTPGTDTQATVLQALGSPTAVGTFNPNNWYYISRTTDTVMFLEAEVVNQRVVAIAFDDTGKVSTIQRFTLDDATAVELVQRETPTGGRELNVWQQLLGNFGRFEPQSLGQ